jgi:hypothetical protein
VVDVKLVEVTSPEPPEPDNREPFKYKLPFDKRRVPKFEAPESRNTIVLVCRLLVIV